MLDHNNFDDHKNSGHKWKKWNCA